MGAEPHRYKTPNRNLGREMRKEDEKSSDVNVQEIASDTHTGNQSVGTNFSHVKKKRR